MLHLSRWADWVEAWIVSRPVAGSTSATSPLVSIGWLEWRCWSKVSTMIRSAAVNAVSTSPHESLCW